MNEELKSRLVRMVEEENRLKTELASDGSLYEGYPQRIRELHLIQANELERIVEAHGWPKISLVGKDGADAAWLVLQHAISRPDFMKRCFRIFESAAQENEANIKHLSCLIDGIRYFSREPQIYGNYFVPESKVTFLSQNNQLQYDPMIEDSTESCSIGTRDYATR